MAELHVVYFEDHPASQLVMKVLLCDILGVEHLTVFESTEDIYNKLSELNPPTQLIFTDINIQPLDGFAVCEWLKSQDQLKEIPVVGVTANISPDGMRHMQTTGFAGVITKPLSHTTFPALFERIMNGETIWEA